MPDAGQPVIDAGPADAGGPIYAETLTGGPLTVTPDGLALGFGAITGRATMVREATGYTDVMVQVYGLETTEPQFATHVHAKACNDEGGGPHYKIDETIEEVIESNEVWPNVIPGPDGEGVGRIRVNHYAAPSARSVVIHEPVEARRIACFDLALNADVVASGTFYPMPAGTAANIGGTAELRRYTGGTVTTVSITGTLQAGATYPAHVHAKACDDEMGGPHYKIDESIAEVVEENELWPSATASMDGMSATGTHTNSIHLARFSAVSVVIHDPDTGDRLACADLKLR